MNQKALESIKNQMTNDPSLAVFMMRDYFPREHYMWGVAYELGNGYCSRTDAEWVLEELLKIVEVED